MIKSWMVIAAVGLLIALGSNLFTPSDVKWFKRLQRPQWLTFEFAIPLIWTFIFICGGWSAYIVWEKDPGTAKTWWLMAFYILVEIAIVAYTPVMFRLRSLKVGTIIGAIGSILGVILAITVWTVSGWAALLLLPYAIWSPIGTYTTWEMIRLNPQDE
ncbi:TspO/MBR family protein [Planktothrix sp. FACHB-1355]|uniref:TspO/MBR family protein n=1 Tax=Aerosakkonema funiforme FACHB-1375 TaxID=2949571 RepID=A0A926ZE89_9CYAN|nr:MULTISPECIES: TspO/MBR family protein [Oscillatoriales]MBD2179813.1 TspO/MBR family protein [Aerosakkonema funiforme FACHB-1375]MBD3557926.1 TspO/MBR family protein [Planktothrix sp. FACHB-1355]